MTNKQLCRIRKQAPFSLWGLTLLEVMVVVAIFSVIFAILLTVFASGRVSFQTQDTQIELQQEVRRAVDRMVLEMHQAGSATISTTLATNDTVTFQIPTGFDANGNVVWGPSIQYFRGGLNNSQLIRTYNGTNTTLANQVASLVFSAPSSEIIAINISMNKTSLSQAALQANMTTRVRLRN